MRTRNVKEFGATGDGTTLDTVAIQTAIDAGGLVYFPPGVYLSGTLYLRSNGGLELSPGAILRGSPNLADYNPADFVPQNSASKAEVTSPLCIAELRARGRWCFSANAPMCAFRT